MKRIFTLLTSLICSFALSGQLCAQSVDEIKADPNYMFGEGWGLSVSSADEEALAAIISQISVTIIDEMEINSKQISTQEQASYEESVKSMLNTYSSATLTNTRRVIVENEPDAHVFRYIRYEDVDRIFDARKTKIKTMLGEAQSALNNRQINDALRYYYWAHALLKSLRHPNEVYVYDEQGTNQMANVWIPQRMNEIFDNLEFNVAKMEDGLLNLQLLYKGDRVSSIDYTIFDGVGWSNIYSAQDGEGVIELRKNFEQNDVRLKVEFAFVNDAVVDPEIKEILNVVPEVAYKKAYHTIKLEVDEPEEVVVEESAQSPNNEVDSLAVTSSQSDSNSDIESYSYPELSQIEDITSYQAIVDRVLLGVVANSTTGIEDYFTAAGMQAYKQLIEYGSARIVDADVPKYYALGDNVYCRNILMNFSFRHNNRSFVESVVFEFDKERKISNVTFGLSRQSTDDIFAMSTWPEQARIILIHFLEGYKSAYALKQIEYVENVFADDALIITGSYTRKATVSEMANISTRNYTMTTQSKSEYIRRLRTLFRSNEYINIHFADTQLIKAGKGEEIYGIQIKQEYHSSSYGDSGYLFLMVDLNDIKKPIIHVRTWQPEKDPNFGIYNLGHF